MAPENQDATAKMQTRGFKMVVHRPMGDVTDATFIISYIVNDLYPVK